MLLSTRNIARDGMGMFLRILGPLICLVNFTQPLINEQLLSVHKHDWSFGMANALSIAVPSMKNINGI